MGHRRVVDRADRRRRGTRDTATSDGHSRRARRRGSIRSTKSSRLYGVANRAVYVLDADGTVTYSWVAEDPTNEPDYGALIEAVEAA